MKAIFPSKCAVCGGQFIPRQTEVALHPTLRGPQGGKKYAHVECIARSNPRGVRIMDQQYEGSAHDPEHAAVEMSLGFDRRHERKSGRRHGEPELVHIRVMKAPAGTNEWRVTYESEVPFVGAGVALQRIINQNSDALPAREIQSAAQQALDALIEEGGSNSLELQRRGQTILVEVAREDRNLAERGYVVPSVEKRKAEARHAQDRQAFSRRVDRYHRKGMSYDTAAQSGGAYGPQAIMQELDSHRPTGLTKKSDASWMRKGGKVSA